MRIVEAFDVLEHCGFRFGLGLEVMSIQQLTFQAREEALGHRIVEAIANRSHRGTNAELLAAFAEGDRGVLTAMIGVMDHLLRTALGKSVFDRLQHQLRLQVIFHRGLSGVSRRRFIITTQRDLHAHAAEDLVQRHFQAAAPESKLHAEL